MREYITIPQKRLLIVAPGIKVDQAILFDFIKGMFLSKSKKVNEHRLNGHVWINYGKVLNDLPILRCKTKNPIGAKMDALEEFGLITTFKKSKDMRNRKYVAVTPLGLGVYTKDGALVDVTRCFAFINSGFTENQAIRMAGNQDFLNAKTDKIIKILAGEFPSIDSANKNRGREDNRRAYIWSMYTGYEFTG